jgi:hypothetical protein
MMFNMSYTSVMSRKNGCVMLFPRISGRGIAFITHTHLAQMLRICGATNINLLPVYDFMTCYREKPYF